MNGPLSVSKALETYGHFNVSIFKYIFNHFCWFQQVFEKIVHINRYGNWKGGMYEQVYV